MKLIRIRIAIITLMTFVLPSAFAQQYEFGVSGGGTGYMGDINSSNPFYFKNLGGGLFAKYNLNSTWGVKLGYNLLFLSGSDQDFQNSNQQQRNLSFNNRISEFALTAEFNFFKYIASRQINTYTPYLIAGLAAIVHDPYIKYNSQKNSLRDLMIEADESGNLVSYSKLSAAVPLGVGFKYNIKGPWSLGAEVIYRTVLTDYIDGVSQYYISADKMIASEKYNLTPEELQYIADPSGNLLNNAGKLRGDGKKFDGYMTAGITLTYTLISKKCYWWE